MGFYVGVHCTNLNQDILPKILEDYIGGDGYNVILGSTHAPQYNNLMNIGGNYYAIYYLDNTITSNLYYGSDINAYTTNDNMYLHDNGVHISAPQYLPYGKHIWSSAHVGSYNGSWPNFGDSNDYNQYGVNVLLFDTYYGSQKTYNIWLQTDSAEWEIYVNENNRFIEKLISVTSGYTYMFTFKTYSEEECDGIIFSTTQLSSGSISDGDGDVCCSGFGSTATYTYTPSSDGTVYVYFMTNSSVFVGPSSSSETYGKFSYTESQVSTRTITLDRTWGSGGSSSVTIGNNDSYNSYPAITDPERSGVTFMGYFTSDDKKIYYPGHWKENIPSNVDTLYAHWYNDIQDNLAKSITVSYSPNNRWVIIGGSVAETMDEIESIVIDDYEDYELGFEVRYDPPGQVMLNIPDISSGTYKLRFIITSSTHSSDYVYGYEHLHDFTITVTKADQPMVINKSSMTLYSITSNGLNNPSGYTYNTGQIIPSNNQGNVTYSSSDTSIATVNSSGVVSYAGAGTCTVTVTAAGNNNYNSGSCICSVTCILDTLQSTKYKDINGTTGENTTSYGIPELEIGGGIIAGGGSARVNCSVKNNISWYQQYKSGWWSDLQEGTIDGDARWMITQNGNNRFYNDPGSPHDKENMYFTNHIVYHNSMETYIGTDTLEITVYNKDDITKTNSKSLNVSNTVSLTLNIYPTYINVNETAQLYVYGVFDSGVEINEDDCTYNSTNPDDIIDIQ